MEPAQNPKNHPDCLFCAKLLEDKELLFKNNHIAAFPLPDEFSIVVFPIIHEENLMKLPQQTLDSFLNDPVKIAKKIEKKVQVEHIRFDFIETPYHHAHWIINLKAPGMKKELFKKVEQVIKKAS